MDGIGGRVKSAREDKGWSQAELAAEVTRRGYKIGQSAIGNLETKQRSDPKCIHELAEALEVSVRWLRTGRPPKSPPGVAVFSMLDVQNTRMSGTASPPLLMWRSSPVGSGEIPGVFMLNAKGKQVERPAYLAGENRAFSFKVVSKENVPVYKVGNRVWVNPDEEIETGEDCLFLQQPTCKDGTLAILGELVRITDRAWIVKQYANPEEEQSLPRKEWPFAWVVVGRERGR